MAQLDRTTFAKLFQLQVPQLLSNPPRSRLEYERLERNLKIFRIERYYNEKTQSIDPFVQQSFTLLDWIAMNNIVNRSTSNDHALMSELSIIRMVYNLLPINRSFLEMLVIGEN